MEESIYEKVIVTTHRKLELVKKLGEYWSLKGSLMNSRKDPTLLEDTEFQSKTADFLMNNSDMKNQKFWNTLSAEKQMATTKVMTFQEVGDETKKIRMVSSRQAAEMYVVLSGSATVRNSSNNEEQIYGPGQVFGSLDYFDSMNDFRGDFDGEELYQTGNNDETGDGRAGSASSQHNGTNGQTVKSPMARRGSKWNIVTAQFTKGAFMRLSLADFYKYVLKPENFDVDEKEKRRDSDIAGIPYEELTEDDFLYINVYKRAQSLLNTHLFSFMDSYHMIPKNSKMHAYRYYNVGTIGRENYLLASDPIHVFIVIDGSMRLEISCVSNVRTTNTVKYKRKGGKQAMTVQTKSMPLLSLQSGSVLCLQSDCYTVGQKERAELILKEKHREHGEYLNMALLAEQQAAAANGGRIAPAAGSSGGGNGPPAALSSGLRKKSFSVGASFGSSFNGGDLRRDSGVSVNSGGTNYSGGSGGSKISKLHKNLFVARPRLNKLNTKGQNPNTCDDEDSKVLYNVKMVFEQPTTYLAVPVQLFDKILDDEKKVLPQISAEIKSQLRHANDSIQHRVENLLPWILGQQDFEHKNDSALPPVYEKPDFYVEDYTTAGEETAPIMGSFLRDTASVKATNTKAPTNFTRNKPPNNNKSSTTRSSQQMLLSKSLTALPNNNLSRGQSTNDFSADLAPPDVDLPLTVQIPILGAILSSGGTGSFMKGSFSMMPPSSAGSPYTGNMTGRKKLQSLIPAHSPKLGSRQNSSTSLLPSDLSQPHDALHGLKSRQGSFQIGIQQQSSGVTPQMSQLSNTFFTDSLETIHNHALHGVDAKNIGTAAVRSAMNGIEGSIESSEYIHNNSIVSNTPFSLNSGEGGDHDYHVMQQEYQNHGRVIGKAATATAEKRLPPSKISPLIRAFPVVRAPSPNGMGPHGMRPDDVHGMRENVVSERGHNFNDEVEYADEDG